MNPIIIISLRSKQVTSTQTVTTYLILTVDALLVQKLCLTCRFQG